MALAGLALVVSATIGLLILTGGPLDRVLFESVSAFATVGLSTGITVASALAPRATHRRYRYPEERPIVG